MWEAEERIIECIGANCSADSFGGYLFAALIFLIAWGFVKDKKD